mmetsp:Transcript_25717/g.56356  ORF Transcript_25717/g.56356 Transcript_25717/m.56356 type:complete len:385 (-) Transcript_25717:211-1365(-)
MQGCVPNPETPPSADMAAAGSSDENCELTGGGPEEEVWRAQTPGGAGEGEQPPKDAAWPTCGGAWPALAGEAQSAGREGCDCCCVGVGGSCADWLCVSAGAPRDSAPGGEPTQLARCCDVGPGAVCGGAGGCGAAPPPLCTPWLPFEAPPKAATPERPGSGGLHCAPRLAARPLHAEASSAPPFLPSAALANKAPGGQHAAAGDAAGAPQDAGPTAPIAPTPEPMAPQPPPAAAPDSVPLSFPPERAAKTDSTSAWRAGATCAKCGMAMSSWQYCCQSGKQSRNCSSAVTPKRDIAEPGGFLMASSTPRSTVTSVMLVTSPCWTSEPKRTAVVCSALSGNLGKKRYSSSRLCTMHMYTCRSPLSLERWSRLSIATAASMERESS